MDTAELKTKLSGTSLFNEVAEQQIDSFLQEFSYRIEAYQPLDVIALMGDPCNALLLVLQGTVSARMVSDTGKFIEIEKIGEGRILAPAMLYATNNRFPVDVIPQEDVVLLKMDKREFLKALQKNDQLLLNFIQIVSDVNKFLTDKIHFLSLRSLRGKLAQYLLSLSESQRNLKRVELSLTRQELADKFGVSRQSLIRSLTELEEEHLIWVDGRVIELLEIQELEKIN